MDFSPYIVVLAFQFLLSQASRSDKYVTCGSVLKLINVDHGVRLHSHEVKYGTGSGQQSVTATQRQEDVNSHWLIKGTTKKPCPRGQALKCGDVIRLHHVSTSKNLHSHYFPSPLSESNQEVSAYGIDGEGDSGDHWMVVCEGEYWERDEEVMLKHVDTDMYLSVSGHKYGSPINGQMEVVGTSRMHSVHWIAGEGIYVHASDLSDQLNAHGHVHSEL
ncbi:Stromal cell-derived factor [Nesidiocoris tenuis]|uniref:Stromal cell-derived factor n=1 Tax=Nesidiocoris tenuis TaxID=355587 RepID=A0ABN7AC08_9HEMI|nr:Stromal cell-derived factor [Nesidiocoris tenuis]